LGIGGEDARVLITFVEEEAAPEPESVIDEAEVPRRPDAIREREERREERDDAEREEAAPALAEDLAAGAEVLRDLLALMGVAVQDTPGVKTESVGVDPNRRVVISSTAPGARGSAPFRPGPPGGFRGGGGPSRYGPRRGFGPRPGGYRPGSNFGPRDRP